MPTDRSTQAFINFQSGTFTDESKEWVLSADQWIQTYWQVRGGKLLLVENDNKEQTYNEREYDIPAFIRQHESDPNDPYPELVAYLKTLPR